MMLIKYLWNKFKKCWIDNYKGIPIINEDDEWLLYNSFINEDYEVEE